MDAELDITKLKYVLYARKSTDDAQRQIRSIDDQVAECREFAERLGIRIVRTVTETKSAKRPGKRPEFMAILRELRKGQYDGILAWQPDRLARNMKEAGELIDMIDERVIKDLKFVTYPFSRDANGLMMLGMAFVLAKQYSDDLSQKVSRGVRRSFMEGKSSGAPKYGYIRTEDGIYIPDTENYKGKNFELVRAAWRLRKENWSLADIAKHMNDNDYGRIIKGTRAKKSGSVVKMDERMLSKMYKDPFFYGVLVQTKQTVDLRDLYEFSPAVSEEDWQEVQKLSNRRLTPMNKKRHTFYPLRGMVFCAFCERPMYPAPGAGYKRYLYYRCDNPSCSRKKRSVRAKIVFNFIYDFLEQGLNFTEQEYQQYLVETNKAADARRVELETNLRSRSGAIKSIEREVNERSLKIIDYDKNTPIWKQNNKHIQDLEVQKAALEGEVNDLKLRITIPEQDKLSAEQFLNLSKSASAKVKAADEIGKDKICRFIYLNLTVNEEKVTSYSLKEPFATLLNNRHIHTGRGERT